MAEKKKSIEFLIKENKKLLKRIKELEKLEIINDEFSDKINELNDIIKGEKKERQLVENKLKLYIEVFEQSSVSVVITNRDGYVEYVNPYFRKLTGYSDQEIIGQNPRLLKSGLQTKEFYEDLWKTILSGQTWKGEFHNKKKNGESYWESCSISPIFDHKNKIVRFVSIKENITEKKKSQLKLKELNATKDRLFSIIAHDLRSPFTALLGYSEFLYNEAEEMSKDDVQEFSGNINSIAKSVYTLLDNLLNWSRIQTGRIQLDPEIINPQEEIKSIVQLFSENIKQKEIKVDFLPCNNQKVFADKHMFSIIVRNLLSNAIKFTNKKGQINISCKNVDEMIEVSVEDSGVGIEPSVLKQLLEKDVYHSTKGTEDEEGSGLGFILCKELVALNKGEIYGESKVGKGTVFKFTLPLQIK